MQKSPHFMNSFLKQSKFQSLKTKKVTPISDEHHPKNIKVTFSFSEVSSTHQKSVYSINSFLRQSQFSTHEARVGTPIFDHAHPNVFQSTINFHESALTGTKSGFFIILLQRYSQYKNPAIYWPSAFCHIFREQDFSHVWDLCKNTAININFLYGTNSGKINV